MMKKNNKTIMQLLYQHGASVKEEDLDNMKYKLEYWDNHHDYKNKVKTGLDRIKVCLMKMTKKYGRISD